jgi:hypothetical protein
MKPWTTSQPDGIASMDLFVVPTISFRLLYGLLILQHGRRQILCLGVTAHPTVEWIARQWRLELVSKQKRKAALVECVWIFHLWPMTALLHFENVTLGISLAIAIAVSRNTSP